MEIKGKYTTATSEKIASEMKRRLNIHASVRIVDKGAYFKVTVNLKDPYAQTYEALVSRQVVKELEGDTNSYICDLLIEKVQDGKRKKIDEHSPLGGW